ncbi:Cytosolic copper metallochaperone [Actinomortierella wolfii]|nr:Cytosolic copper metallochaperone [Actinomortierella wolfii]KAG0231199.1 Cytosolic copper metallochaperone [Actinomortierella wolfii]
MAQYKYDVTMSCGGCAGAVKKALAGLEGVESFDVSLENQQVTVVSSSLTETQVLEAILSTGKKAKVAEN